MNIWKSFGASVIGPGHIVTGKPNQDSWRAFHHVWGDGIAVSDGLGSKSLSGFGSDAACRSVEQSARRFSYQKIFAMESTAREKETALSDCILNSWLNMISPLSPKDCAATCLFAFRLGDGILRMGMLGDGCTAAVMTDGSVISLTDDKSEGFSNLTSALSSNTEQKHWTIRDISEQDCTAVVLCTDGVSDDLDNVDGFIAGFAKSNYGLASITASRHTREMLEDWPVPKHSDDKTIACLYREEIIDE